MFQNDPAIDFTIEANRDAFTAALSQVENDIRQSRLYAAPIIGGKEQKGGEQRITYDPSEPETAIGAVHYSTSADVAAAFESLSKSSWKSTPGEQRVAVLKKTAAIMREKRLWLSALIVREVGKPWREADADVAEAIDFCSFYAAEMERLSERMITMPVPGEQNIYFYRPRGISVVIAPWNFPLAIACGMSVAALVAGNPVILKPAEQSSIVAFEFARFLLEAGVHSDSFAFLPGQGETIGQALVKDSRTSLICFTGSKAVGLEILKSAAEVAPGQRHIKKAITELGGKNCIIVDEDADLDEAIRGILYSAFGYAGQKCSAASRLVVLHEVYDILLERLAQAAQDLIVGKAADPASYFGPVIDRESQDRILATIKKGKASLRVLAETKAPANGYFVPGTIFADVTSESPIWTEEIFGPVLACRKARNFDDALDLANDSQYALTGGLYSRSPRNIARVYNELEAGNIYINRHCTGALVCRQPFGGYKLSGIGSKAGGKDYLIQFLEPVTVSENTMRRGFAPET